MEEQDTPRAFAHPSATTTEPLEATFPPETPPSSAPTVLDELKADLGAAVALEPARIPVPLDLRPGWEAEFTRDVPQRLIDELRKTATDKVGNLSVLDGMKFWRLVIATLNTALYRNGERLTLDGDVTTFRSKSFWELLPPAKDGSPIDSAQKAVGAFYVVDAAAFAVGQRIGEASGWNAAFAGAGMDPTEG